VYTQENSILYNVVVLKEIAGHKLLLQSMANASILLDSIVYHWRGLIRRAYQKRAEKYE